MPTITIITIGLVFLITYLIRPVRLWFSKEENFNSGVLLVAVFGLVIALPIFSKQINNVQVEIDSIQTSLQEMYNKQHVESFTSKQARDFKITEDEEGTKYFEISLQKTPVNGSVMLWFLGAMQPPDWYKLKNNIIQLRINSTIYSEKTLREIIDSDPDYPITVSYISAQ